MDADGIKVAIFGAAIALLIISTGLIIFMLMFYRYKRKSIIDKQERKLSYLKAITETEQEIQHETLNAIGRELHDNVGQLLTVANMHLNSVQEEIADNRLEMAEEVLNKAVRELRQLAKSLNAERIKEIGLLGVLEAEKERLNHVEGIQMGLTLNGTDYSLGLERETILFRIIQEFLANSIKHAQASVVKVQIDFKMDGVSLAVLDNGIGFDFSKKNLNKGSGLRNMKVRADMIHATFDYSSVPQRGTKMNIFIPKTNIHA